MKLIVTFIRKFFLEYFNNWALYIIKKQWLLNQNWVKISF